MDGSLKTAVMSIHRYSLYFKPIVDVAMLPAGDGTWSFACPSSFFSSKFTMFDNFSCALLLLKMCLYTIIIIIIIIIIIMASVRCPCVVCVFVCS